MMGKILTRPIPRARRVFYRFQNIGIKPEILRHDAMHHLPVDIGEPEIATARALSEFLVIEAEQLLRVAASRQVDEAVAEAHIQDSGTGGPEEATSSQRLITEGAADPRESSIRTKTKVATDTMS
jgi:hypothetical protein